MDRPNLLATSYDTYNKAEPSFLSPASNPMVRAVTSVFCFRYITYPETGCVTSTCHYYHFDANSSTQYKILQTYFHDILQFIRRPELAPYFQSTERLTKLATQR